jgi:hypothetical protein
MSDFSRFQQINDPAFAEAFELIVGERQLPPGRNTADVRREALAVVRDILDRAGLRPRSKDCQHEFARQETPITDHQAVGLNSPKHIESDHPDTPETTLAVRVGS